MWVGKTITTFISLALHPFKILEGKAFTLVSCWMMDGWKDSRNSLSFALSPSWYLQLICSRNERLLVVLSTGFFIQMARKKTHQYPVCACKINTLKYRHVSSTFVYFVNTIENHTGLGKHTLALMIKYKSNNSFFQDRDGQSMAPECYVNGVIFL